MLTSRPRRDVLARLGAPTKADLTLVVACKGSDGGSEAGKGACSGCTPPLPPRRRLPAS